MTNREVKALSDDEIAGLLAGEGMQMALPAELNGYPGPKHVLELADSLDLTEAQRAAVVQSRERMLSTAQALGAEIVSRERALDSLFANKLIDEATLIERTERIGVARGMLRAAHLKAHLEMVEVLRPEQVERYGQLRGYGGHH